ncbi:transcriptional regulator [Cedecea sp. P7760]|uniref:transcriptional regulator n=1 Tax=Cedecea sp. P7760 TaxID=2726983 RepID=UPI0015A37417|nr:transcriptional regulator [Cedecea sp. P7760]NWC65420.1 transcriptional regulator [Cedecea sp. P7760]
MTNELLNWRRSSTKEEWLELARRAGTSAGYLNLVAYGYRNASPRLALSIETASQGFVGKELISKEGLVFNRGASINES